MKYFKYIRRAKENKSIFPNIFEWNLNEDLEFRVFNFSKFASIFDSRIKNH